MKTQYWKSILALVLMPIFFYFNWVEFYFAILFFIWSIQGIKKGVAFLLDDVYREKSPVLFWMISLLWILLSILSLAYSEPIMNWYNG